VPKHDRQPRAKARSRKLNAADLGGRHDIPSYPDDEEVTKPLPENELCGNTRVGTPQDDGKGRLRNGELPGAALGERGSGVTDAGNKATVARAQPSECFLT